MSSHLGLEWIEPGFVLDVVLTFYLRLACTAFFWSIAFYSVNEVVHSFPVYLGAFFRFFFASLFLGVLTHFYGGWPDLSSWASRKDLLFLGIVGVFLYNICFFLGIKFSDPVTGSLIVAANPAVTAVVSSVWKKEHSGILRWLGIGISFLGLLLVLSRGSLQTLLGLEFHLGDLFIFGASICWAFYSVKGREVLHTQPVLGTTTVACIIGAVLLFPAGLAEWMMEGPRSLGFLIVPENAMVWLHLMYLGFFASGIAFLFWYQGVRALGAPRASVFINLVPVFAMLISILMGKWPAVYQWMGASVVLLGVYITSRSGQPKTAT